MQKKLHVESGAVTDKDDNDGWNRESSSNWEQTEASSCCGVLELKNIKSSFDWGGIKTDSKKRSAFRNFISDAKKSYGAITIYLLPHQIRGDIGKMAKHFNFTRVGKFYNPGTRHTLVTYVKTLNRSKPRPKKRRKAAFSQ